jgi:hypothetical protein
MPTLSRFYGITITMAWSDYNPPHFHALYGHQKAQVVIATGRRLEGSLPPRAIRLVRQWASHMTIAEQLPAAS